MEHVERQNEREREIRGQVDELEHQGDELEERNKQLDEQIDRTRAEWERAQQSDNVPGAQPEGGHPVGHDPPVEAEITPGDDQPDVEEDE